MLKLIHKLLFIVGCIAFFLPANGQEALSPTQQIEVHRKKQDEEMKSATSPLLPKDKRRFKGLKYFPANLDYRVTAKFIRTENPVLFKMKTTKDFRNPEYVKYGEVHFTLKGLEYVLEVYQSPDISKKEEYKDHLFIPFTDETNGHETYDVGRYLDVRIPEGDELVLDFNLCYNPYCSYSPNYACPIPPAANNLKTRIEAGEKIFKKH
jgi:uncharacterized protein